MKVIIKMALLPVIAVLWVLWIIATAASRIYGLTHGFLWAVLLVLIALACILQMWQNALFFLAMGVGSYLILFGLTSVAVLIETAKQAFIGMIVS